ncbi:hypothetical protein Leryth_017202 [Lithospermum erythrorhizon]|nr:hypothetical protein Leryth_017202 [Lithospermum erythrorhizon]
MKILEANAGVLTNFEVLDFLKSRGAGKDPTRLTATVAPIEFKVYAYLEQSAASNLTRDNVIEFMEKCKNYKLAKAEILNIINILPSSCVEIDPIVEESETRFGDSLLDLVEVVTQMLPAPPIVTEPNEGNNEEEPAAGEEEHIE